MLRSNQLSYTTKGRNYSQILLAIVVRLLVRELGFALVDECVHAFFLVGSGKQGVEQAAPL